MPLKLSVILLPAYRWSTAKELWCRAEELGFHAAYTYDHLSWRSFRDRVWFDAVATLAAAATVTKRIRLGTLVTSPNFRHPVPLAKEFMTLDDVSRGRLTVGVGAGSEGFDTVALGAPPLQPAERVERFEEFVRLLCELLGQEVTTSFGQYYSSRDVRMIPGCLQLPRPPLYIAATGPRGLRTVARFGAAWVTAGDPKMAEGTSSSARIAAIRKQKNRLIAACEIEHRNPGDLDVCVVHGTRGEPQFSSVDAFVDYAGRCREIGATEITLHWPIPDSIFSGNLKIFERIAQEGLSQFD